MGRGTRWFLVIVVVLAALLTAHTAWLATARRSFEQSLRAARAVLPGREAAPPAGERNAAPLVRRADERAGPYPLNGALRTDPSEWSEDERAAVEAWVAESDGALQLLEEAAGCSRCEDAEDDPRDPLLPRLMNVQRLLYCRTAVGRGGLDTVALQLELAAKLDQPTILLAAMRHHMVSFALDGLVLVSRRPGFDAAAARGALAPRLAAELEQDDVAELLAAERAYGLTWVDRWATGEFDAGHRVHGVDLGETMNSWLKRPLAFRDARRYIEESAEMVRLAEEGGDLGAFGERIERLPDHYPLTRHLARLPGLAHELVERHHARVRVAGRGLAALEQHAKTGAWPADVDAQSGLPRVREGEAEWILADPTPEDR